MTEQPIKGQVTLFDLDTWSGRTCQEPSPATEGKTSRPSSRRSSGSSARKRPMCLCLIGGGGHTQGCSTMTWDDGALLGDYTTHSTGEFPSEENASRLSQILEVCPQEKYSLSAKACDGILRRAEKRGKALPEALKVALEKQSLSKSGQESPGGQGNLNSR